MSENADQHGPTCAETPADHRCGDSEADQMVTWSEMVRLFTEQSRHIASLHVKVVGHSGMTDGTCAECGHLWPCQTVHLANGWGWGDSTKDGREDCFATGWCEHASVPCERIYEPAEYLAKLTEEANTDGS